MKKLYIALFCLLLLGGTPLTVTPMFDEVDCCIKDCS